MTRQVCRQTKSLRRWARTVRTPLLARNLFIKCHIHARATHSFFSYSWEDISALGRAAILGSRRPARNPVHLAEILRRLPRGRLRRRCGRPRAPQRGLGSLRYVSSLSPITLENNPRPKTATGDGRTPDTVLSAPQILGVPLLLLANKQDNPESLSVAEIRHDYEEWYQHKIESARRRQGSEMDSAERRERIASLDVMGLSALEG